MEVEDRRPAGRPCKTWRQCVEDDMGRMNTREESILSSRVGQTHNLSNPIREKDIKQKEDLGEHVEKLNRMVAHEEVCMRSGVNVRSKDVTCE